MTQMLHSTGPDVTREECYRLLAEAAPQRVIVDTTLLPGRWYVVRGETRAERLTRLAQEERYRLDAEEKNRLAGAEGAT